MPDASPWPAADLQPPPVVWPPESAATAAAAGCCCDPATDPACACLALANAQTRCATVSGGPSSGPTTTNRTVTLTRSTQTSNLVWSWSDPNGGLPGQNARQMFATCSDGRLCWHSYESYAESQSCPGQTYSVSRTWSSECYGCIAVSPTMCRAGVFTGPADAGRGSYRFYTAGCVDPATGAVPGYYQESQGGSITISIGSCGPSPIGGGDGQMAAVAASAEADALSGCRHRPAERVSSAEADAAGLSPQRDWYRCGRVPLPSAVTADGMVSDCRTCGIPAGRQCGPACQGYEPGE